MFMKNILTMAATGLVIFAGLGWYLDWYKVARTTTPDGKQHIVIDVNTPRIKSDIASGTSQVPGYWQTNPGQAPPLQQPAPYPAQPYQQYPPQQQPVPNPGFFPQQPAPPTYQQQPQSPWAPYAPTSRPNAGGFAPPAQPGYVQPPPNLPGRPF
jgi:hypothetical protein